MWEVPSFFVGSLGMAKIKFPPENSRYVRFTLAAAFNYAVVVTCEFQ
jgi:hypothetical protein